MRDAIAATLSFTCDYESDEACATHARARARPKRVLGAFLFYRHTWAGEQLLVLVITQPAYQAAYCDI